MTRSPERRAPALIVILVLLATRLVVNVAIPAYAGTIFGGTFVRLAFGLIVSALLYMAVRRGSELGRWLMGFAAIFAAATSTFSMAQLSRVSYGVPIFAAQLAICIAIAWIVSSRSIRDLTPRDEPPTF